MRTFRLLVALLAVTQSATVSIGADPVAKLPLPDEAAQAKARMIVSEVYKSDYDKAKTPAQKIELATKLLKDGLATKDDIAARFVLFRIARDIAAQQGDLRTALEAISVIGKEFDADVLQMQAEAATTSVSVLKTTKDFRTVGDLLVPLIDTAVAADRFELAKSLAEQTLRCAREVRDTDQIRFASTKSVEIDQMAAEFSRAKEAFDLLHTKPADPSANEIVGKYRCFTKGEWTQGIPMLALGNDETLKQVAILELDDNRDLLKIGDAWWKIAEELPSNHRDRVRSHAAESYAASLPKLTGLSKTRVEKILLSIGRLEEGNGNTPLISGLWLESPGVVFSLQQEGNRFTAETKYKHPKAGTIKAIMEGTLSSDGSFVATLKHVEAPKGWQSQTRQGNVSADRKTIKGKARLEDGTVEEFNWTSFDRRNLFIGTWITPAGRTVVVHPNGEMTTSLKTRGRWTLKDDKFQLVWADGKTEVCEINLDGTMPGDSWKRK